MHLGVCCRNVVKSIPKLAGNKMHNIIVKMKRNLRLEWIYKKNDCKYRCRIHQNARSKSL